MDPDHMSVRAPRSPIAGTGWLWGWRLTFAGGSALNPGPHSDMGALATVVEDPRSSVFVVLYDMAAEDVAMLDRWEGTDRIAARRLRSRVRRLPNLPAGPPVDAQYSEFTVSSDVTSGVPGADLGRDLDPDLGPDLGGDTLEPEGEDVIAAFHVLDAFEGGMPQAAYLGQLADAAESAGAPAEYVRGLRTRPCAPGGGLAGPA